MRLGLREVTEPVLGGAELDEQEWEERVATDGVAIAIAGAGDHVAAGSDGCGDGLRP